jgi:hypothetical protein
MTDQAAARTQISGRLRREYLGNDESGTAVSSFLKYSPATRTHSITHEDQT